MIVPAERFVYRIEHIFPHFGTIYLVEYLVTHAGKQVAAHPAIAHATHGIYGSGKSAVVNAASIITARYEEHRQGAVAHHPTIKIVAVAHQAEKIEITIIGEEVIAFRVGIIRSEERL